MLQYVDPVKILRGKLLTVDKPARYVGGEVGCLASKKEELAKRNKQNENDLFRTVIAFPDLYEIGMGNHALRIIYNYMNNIDGIVCDYSFAPAPDFEKLLREEKIPLYGLETGISLASADILMFTLGYELGLNGILTMLDVSGIPLRCEERKQQSARSFPIIIAGGPAVSNPLPYSHFIDAFWIGEAEAGFFDLVKELNAMKKNGEGREALLEKIFSHRHIWAKGSENKNFLSKEKVKRAIYADFSGSESPLLVYPVPSMKIVQNHGNVEIMRGCPNGCRFCHAGFWYRPARQKSAELISKQVKDLTTKGGWQQISLSSLSSGDYLGIDNLVGMLNDQFAKKHVSFQLPSLKVSSFALSILEKISVTRKSGLTFAVETPVDAWQLAINKEVTRDSVTAIIEEAKKRGWKGAKFYFMIGLRTEDDRSEEEEIVSFIIDVARKTRTHFNINVGIFIPKPHTPFQWVPQLDNETALKKLLFIRSKLKPLGHKVSISDPLISRLEGMLSRGDERAGLLCEEAFKSGCRLDAWDEFINKDKWLEILEKNNDYVCSIFNRKSVSSPLPWSQIDPCAAAEYLKNELEKSNISESTPSCRTQCSLCGVCNKEIKLSTQTDNYKDIVNHTQNTVNNTAGKSDPVIYRMLFSFKKEGSAVFHGHLHLIEIFSMSFRRADIPVKYTLGFNPLAKIEFASPLGIGISAENEIAAADFYEPFDAETFLEKLNLNLPQGILINKTKLFLIKSGEKKHSLSSLLWGASYENADKKPEYVTFSEEKVYRQKRLDNDCVSLFDLKRHSVLARNIIGGADEWADFFNVYSYLYGIDKSF
ncbi:MAG: TIGR03960 family B12-binding radical SAM protein [Treponema sp.]|nr:TIGR03960 family B12-binding radical SAM protein [Treponema sp.]